MTEYENEAKARDAAEKWAAMASIETQVRHQRGVMFWVVPIGTDSNIAEFTYPPPVEIPKKGQAVMCDGVVYFSRGYTSDDGKLSVSEQVECFDADNQIPHWIPVEIVRNGGHARALELLERLKRYSVPQSHNGLSDLKDEIAKFLAEAKKGA